MPLTVSSNCPSCGGSLDYEEGTNAVHCSYCGSDHLVTGHGRVLSYFIPEKLTASRAVALSLLKLKAEGRSCKAREATLFFVPFYHFTAKSLFWEAQELAVTDGPGGQQSGL
jgi:LSD1 subclass zinc finger protein